MTFGKVETVANAVIESLPTDPTSYASQLFDALHRLDEAELNRLVISLPSEGDDWLAIHDRLGRMGKTSQER